MKTLKNLMDIFRFNFLNFAFLEIFLINLLEINFFFFFFLLLQTF